VFTNFNIIISNTYTSAKKNPAWFKNPSDSYLLFLVTEERNNISSIKRLFKEFMLKVKKVHNLSLIRREIWEKHSYVDLDTELKPNSIQRNLREEGRRNRTQGVPP